MADPMMKLITPLTLALARPIAVLTITLATTILFILYSHAPPPIPTSPATPMSTANATNAAARSFILWLHGLGDSGPANEPIKSLFTSPEFKSTKWLFPSASWSPVTCNHGAVMPSWFDIHEIPVTAYSPKDETGVLRAVKNVHALIDKEIAAGTNPNNVFVCGFSQGGALTLASVLLHPKTLGGGAVFSGWVPFNDSVVERFPEDAKKTPILWSHGMADPTVLFEAGQAGPPFLQKAGVSCEFKYNNNNNHKPSASKGFRISRVWGIGVCSLPPSGGYPEGRLFPRTPSLESWSAAISQRSGNRRSNKCMSMAKKKGIDREKNAAQAPITDKAYPRLGHSITEEELKYLESWIKTRLQSSS